MTLSELTVDRKPYHFRDPHCEFLECTAASETRCPRCGHVGMNYHAYQRGNRHVAIAECPKCSEAFEF